MKHSPDKIRKAALLVATLDPRSADAVLDQMPPEQSALIRRALMEMDDVDRAEQDGVILEFLRHRGAPLRDDGVELEPSLIQRMSRREERSPPDTEPAPPFRFLHEAEADDLGRLLRREHPQVSAVVLSHLPPRQAARVLSVFPAELQTAVLRRVADLEVADADVLRDLEKELECVLKGTFGGHARRIGVKAVRAILDAAEEPERDAMLQGLAQSDRALADSVAKRPLVPPEPKAPLPEKPSPTPPPRATEAPTVAQSPPEAAEPEPEPPDVAPAPIAQPTVSSSDPLTFDDVMALEEDALALVFNRADPRVTLLALAGARPEFVARLLDRLPAREARSVRRRMQELRPLLLRDVEAAQARLAAMATDLVMQQQIAPPRRRGFAAAA